MTISSVSATGPSNTRRISTRGIQLLTSHKRASTMVIQPAVSSTANTVPVLRNVDAHSRASAMKRKPTT